MLDLNQIVKMCEEEGTHIVSLIHDENRSALFERYKDDGLLRMRVFDENAVCIYMTTNEVYIYYCYIKIAAQERKTSLDSLVESLSFNEAVFDEDYDLYSDMYKDEHNVRPHLTNTEWLFKVNRVQNDVYRSILMLLVSHFNIFQLTSIYG